jgi:hypothetical protein
VGAGAVCRWQNGRIERLHEFASFYNHVRVHQGLAGLTPAKGWSGQDLNAVKRRYGQGRCVQALAGLMLGYWLRR